MGTLKRVAVEVLEEAIGVDRCFVCGEVIRGDGVYRPTDMPGEGRSDCRVFHSGCWDR